MSLLPDSTREALAGEYVLGTLQGQARQQFELLLRDDLDLRQRVAYWESRLEPMLAEVAPVTPSDAIWEQILQRIQPSRHAGMRAWTPPWFRFALVLVALAGGAWLLKDPVRQQLLIPDIEVAIQDDTRSYWTIEADTHSGRIALAALSDVPLDAGRSFELWLLRDKDQPPVSLGLLPVVDGERVQRKVSADFSSGTGFAVSVEPTGGSPSGAPTGPVVHVRMLTS